MDQDGANFTAIPYYERLIASTSGLAMNIVIDQQLNTVPMQSSDSCDYWEHRKGPLFVPAEVLVQDRLG